MTSFIKYGPMLSGPGDFDWRRLPTSLSNSFLSVGSLNIFVLIPFKQYE